MSEIELNDKLKEWLISQPVCFLGTAPTHGQHVNVSPKGLDGTIRFIDEDLFNATGHVRLPDSKGLIAFADVGGSGIETIAHLQENGRITLCFQAFSGAPRIVRLYGKGFHVEPQEKGFQELGEFFSNIEEAKGLMFNAKGESQAGKIREYVIIDVYSVRKSCGYAVPLMDLVEQRIIMTNLFHERSLETLEGKREAANEKSLDGLPGLRWSQKERKGVASTSQSSGSNVLSPPSSNVNSSRYMLKDKRFLIGVGTGLMGGLLLAHFLSK